MREPQICIYDEGVLERVVSSNCSAFSSAAAPRVESSPRLNWGQSLSSQSHSCAPGALWPGILALGAIAAGRWGALSFWGRLRLGWSAELLGFLTEKIWFGGVQVAESACTD